MSLCSDVIDTVTTEEIVDPFDEIESPTMLQISIGIGSHYTPELAGRLTDAVDKVLENIGGILGDLMEEHIADVYDLNAIKKDDATAEDFNVDPCQLVSASKSIH